MLTNPHIIAPKLSFSLHYKTTITLHNNTKKAVWVVTYDSKLRVDTHRTISLTSGDKRRKRMNYKCTREHRPLPRYINISGGNYENATRQCQRILHIMTPCLRWASCIINEINSKAHRVVRSHHWFDCNWLKLVFYKVLLVSWNQPSQVQNSK